MAEQKGDSASTSKPAAKPKKKKKLFMKQPQMMRMVYALIPVQLSAIYFFGWRSLAITLTCLVVGTLVEYITSRQRKAMVSQAVFVTCMLYGMSLPVTVPFYVAIVGIVVAVLFGKEVFGGFGRNFANPAIVGRAFVYVSFPNALTGAFVPAFGGFPGGFAKWSFESLNQLPGYLAENAKLAGKTVTDAVSQASPMWVMRDVTRNIGTEEAGYSYWNMFFGNIGGAFQQDGQWRVLSAGSMGEGCAALILLCAIYLLVTKTANYRLMLGALIGAAVANTLFRDVMGYNGPEGVPPLLFNLLAGTTLYAMVFMVTDPVSATKQKPAQWAYAITIGFMMVFMRWKGVFVAAASFAILFGNIVGPLYDQAALAWDERKKRLAEGKEGGNA